MFGCGLSDGEIKVQRCSNSHLCVTYWDGDYGMFSDDKYTVMIAIFNAGWIIDSCDVLLFRSTSGP